MRLPCSNRDDNDVEDVPRLRGLIFTQHQCHGSDTSSHSTGEILQPVSLSSGRNLLPFTQSGWMTSSGFKSIRVLNNSIYYLQYSARKLEIWTNPNRGYCICYSGSSSGSGGRGSWVISTLNQPLLALPLHLISVKSWKLKFESQWRTLHNLSVL